MRGLVRARDFVEVETGVLQVSPGNETHLHAFATERSRPGRRSAAALSAHLAGIRLQEAAGRRRDAHLQLRTRVPQPRARRRCTIPNSPCSNGIGQSEPYEALMGDCAALLALAAKAGRRDALALARPRGRSVRRARTAERRRRLRAPSPASTCWPTLDGAMMADARRACAPRRRRRRARRAGRTWSDIFSRVVVEKIEPQARHRARRQCCTNIRSREAALARPKPPIRASPSASSSMPAASSSPTPSASSPTPPSSAGASRPRWTEKAARLWRALPDRRGFSRRARAHAAGERHRARVRPLGHARNGRGSHRAGDLDAIALRRALDLAPRRGNGEAMPTATLPLTDARAEKRPARRPRAPANQRCVSCRGGAVAGQKRGGDAAVAERYAVAVTPAHGRAHRSRRSRRSDRAAIPARSRRARDRAGGACRSDRR